VKKRRVWVVLRDGEVIQEKKCLRVHPKESLANKSYVFMDGLAIVPATLIYTPPPALKKRRSK